MQLLGQMLNPLTDMELISMWLVEAPGFTPPIPRYRAKMIAPMTTAAMTIAIAKRV